MDETILKQVTDQEEYQDDEYEVEKILDHARIGNKIYFKGNTYHIYLIKILLGQLTQKQ